MKQLFMALVAVIFVWRRINAPPPAPSTVPSDDFTAPLTAVLTQATGDLVFAAVVAGVMCLIGWMIWNYWR